MKTKKHCNFKDIPYYNDDEEFNVTIKKMAVNDQDYKDIIENILISYYSTFFGDDIFSFKVKNNYVLAVMMNEEIDKLRLSSRSYNNRYRQLLILEDLRKKETMLCKKFFSERVLNEIKFYNALTNNLKEISNEYIYTRILFRKLIKNFEIDYNKEIVSGFHNIFCIIEYLEKNIDNFEEYILCEIRKIYFNEEIIDLNDVYEKYIETFDNFLNENVTGKKSDVEYLHDEKAIKLDCEDIQNVISNFNVYRIPSGTILNIYEFLEDYYKKFFSKILKLRNIEFSSKNIDIDQYYDYSKDINIDRILLIKWLFSKIKWKENEIYHSFKNDESIKNFIGFEEFDILDAYIKTLYDPISIEYKHLDIENYPLESLYVLFLKVEDHFNLNKHKLSDNLYEIYAEKYPLIACDDIETAECNMNGFYPQIYTAEHKHIYDFKPSLCTPTPITSPINISKMINIYSKSQITEMQAKRPIIDIMKNSQIDEYLINLFCYAEEINNNLIENAIYALRIIKDREIWLSDHLKMLKSIKRGYGA